MEETVKPYGFIPVPVTFFVSSPTYSKIYIRVLQDFTLFHLFTHYDVATV